ncbi:CBS domain-containing protein [Bacillus sp. FJAT-27225]|uniref:CBS domain-containing protein n=1 Tax=Bacillus sp. FJAT-27225 TaxID=1743144 RepID=UPI00080C274A|nr:CBS domain-containing protein [Bacillus sp. FJAT-27225]OCA90609.1 CBS domain-containing protein [Bacillus sp. FJAT-27225]
MKVKDFMIENVISVSPDMTLAEVMTVFVEKKIGGVPVCSEDGKLLGMVTDGDILRAIQPIDRMIYYFMMYLDYLDEVNVEKRIEDTASANILSISKTKNLVTVTPEDDMDAAVKLLAKHHFKKLPVVDSEQKVVGVISRGDVIRKIQATILKGQ